MIDDEFGLIDEEFTVRVNDDGSVVLTMIPAVAADLANALTRYNKYRIDDGINPDSGWADVAAALTATGRTL